MDTISEGKLAARLKEELEPYLEQIREDVFAEWSNGSTREDRESLFYELKALQRIEFRLSSVIHRGQKAEKRQEAK